MFLNKLSATAKCLPSTLGAVGGLSFRSPMYMVADNTVVVLDQAEAFQWSDL